MKMKKIHKTITKIMRNHRIQLENQEHCENLKITCKNHENHEKVHAKITKIMNILHSIQESRKP